MEFSPMSGVDVFWFCVDKDGWLSASASADGYVPAFVHADLDMHVELRDYIQSLPKSEPNSIINPGVLEEVNYNIYDESKHNILDWVCLTERGVYTYDNNSSDQPDFDVYNWVTKPIVKLNVSALPEHFKDKLYHLPDRSFSDLESFKVDNEGSIN